MRTTNQNRPWLDENRKVFSDKKITTISKSWNQETWDLFLKETVERSNSYQREELISNYKYEEACEEMTESVWKCALSHKFEHLHEFVRRACKDYLTTNQQYIIRRTYWDGMSERQIADIMQVSRSTVAVQKIKSHKKIKDLVEARQSNFPRYERDTHSNPTQKRSPDEELRQVYNEDLKGSYIK